MYPEETLTIYPEEIRMSNIERRLIYWRRRQRELCQERAFAENGGRDRELAAWEVNRLEAAWGRAAVEVEA